MDDVVPDLAVPVFRFFPVTLFRYQLDLSALQLLCPRYSRITRNAEVGRLQSGDTNEAGAARHFI
jgi:hypothetical protein